MRTAQTKQTAQTRSHRPRAITVFAAAFVAGAAAAVGVNRTLDVRLAQSKPRVESEAIFVALRSLPQGAPVTVWDVALRDWPKAMMPASALRASDTFSGHLLKHPLREGQPLLSIQLVPAGQGAQPAAAPTAVPPPASYTQASAPTAPAAEGDLWSPAEPVKAQPHRPATQPASEVASPVMAPVVSPVAVQPTETSQPTTSVAVAPATAPQQQQTVAQIPTQETVPQPEQVASAEPTKTEPTPTEPTKTGPAAPATSTVAAADAPAMTETTAPASDVTAQSSEATPSSTPPQDDGVAAAAEAVVTDSAARATESASPSDTVSQPPTRNPEPTATSDVAVPPESVTTSDVPEPTVAMPTTPVAPLPIAASPPTPAAPVDAPRPTYSRYLVVPESIAVQADASFATRPAAQEQPAEATMPTGQQAASRSGSNAVRPLPSTTTANRGSQARPQSGPQGRPPQRQGRQAQPTNLGTPATTTPPPRLGAAMFPNLSAGIDAIEGRFRGDQPTQGQAPSATQARPLTAR